MANEKYVEQFLGTENSRNEVVAVGVANVLISSAAKRKSVYLRNTSAGGEVISIVFSNTTDAVAGTGIVLGAGEYVIDSDAGDYKCWTGRIQAISSGAGGLLSVVEVF